MCWQVVLYREDIYKKILNVQLTSQMPTTVRAEQTKAQEPETQSVSPTRKTKT